MVPQKAQRQGDILQLDLIIVKCLGVLQYNMYAKLARIKYFRWKWKHFADVNNYQGLL
jgi:hypothetical protein